MSDSRPVLSVAYSWSNPSRAVASDYDHVRAENDWVAAQVARYPDRLRAFCSINPLSDYALAELDRCSKNPLLAAGLKLHFANSAVDYHNPQHLARCRQVFHAANEHQMAIVIHMRASISRRLPYGRTEAQISSTRSCRQHPTCRSKSPILPDRAAPSFTRCR